MTYRTIFFASLVTAVAITACKEDVVSDDGGLDGGSSPNDTKRDASTASSKDAAVAADGGKSDAAAHIDARVSDGEDSGADAGASATVGKAGGKVESEDGSASLTVPAGALDKPTTFTIERVESADSSKLGSDVYALGPDGTFDADVELCLSTKKGADTSQACLGYYDEKSKGWVCEDACVPSKGDGNVICGETNHFTNFAVLLSGGGGKGDACDDHYITSSGGKLISPDGKATLTVPEGALSEGRRISVSEPGDDATKLGSSVYEFLPDGLSFEKDVTLCVQPNDADTSNACLGYRDDTGKWKCEDTCLERKKDGSLCGSTNHFTSFAILLSGGSGKDDPCDDKLITSSGGTLIAPDGKTTLTVPTDAVSGPTRFTIVETSLDSAALGSKVYTLSPSGGGFTIPVELCLPTTISGSTEGACLGYLNEDEKWVCQDGCLIAKENNTLCGDTDHFTNFAILLSGGSCK